MFPETYFDTTNAYPEWLEVVAMVPRRVLEDCEEMLEYDAALRKVIVPPRALRLAAFEWFEPRDTRVCILGQDPYIRVGQAMGLSFSVPPGIAVPPSLRNIQRELRDDGFEIADPSSGDLRKWAEQGVLLLNSALTTVLGKSNSHQRIWKPFTAAFLTEFSRRWPNVVQILMGREASDAQRHIVGGRCIVTPHPSPLARGAFFGSRPFSRANTILRELGRAPIDWSL